MEIQPVSYSFFSQMNVDLMNMPSYESSTFPVCVQLPLHTYKMSFLTYVLLLQDLQKYTV